MHSRCQFDYLDELAPQLTLREGDVYACQRRKPAIADQSKNIESECSVAGGRSDDLLHVLQRELRADGLEKLWCQHLLRHLIQGELEFGIVGLRLSLRAQPLEGLLRR
jgi:hypothetical protein